MDEKKLFWELKTIKKLLAANVIEGKNLKEQVRLLSDVGLQPNDIAEITGKSANLIRVTKFSLKGKIETEKSSEIKEEENKNE